MSSLPTACPSCATPLRVSRLSCERCDTQLEGSFGLPALLRLDAADLDFVLAFVRSSGSLKQMAKRCGQSYPTIRARLDRIIARLDQNPDAAEQQRRAILDAIAAGTLSVAEAAEKLREVSG